MQSAQANRGPIMNLKVDGFLGFLNLHGASIGNPIILFLGPCWELCSELEWNLSNLVVGNQIVNFIGRLYQETSSGTLSTTLSTFFLTTCNIPETGDCGGNHSEEWDFI